jgi:acetyl-CoA carboxylase biotin carboxyl carrier protein
MSVDTQAPQPAGHPLEAHSLEALCQQAKVLAAGLPGTLTRLAVTVGENRVEVEWQPVTVVAGVAPAANGAAPAATIEDAEPETGPAVVAPLVGTFYRASGPDAAPFVSEGDLVEAGQQVGIVEAMKIMNAVQADQAGRVAKILVADGDMVEYGQPLMILESADAES